MFIIGIVGMVSTLLMPRGKPARETVPEVAGHPVDEATLPDGETLVIAAPVEAAQPRAT